MHQCTTHTISIMQLSWRTPVNAMREWIILTPFHPEESKRKSEIMSNSTRVTPSICNADIHSTMPLGICLMKKKPMHASYDRKTKPKSRKRPKFMCHCRRQEPQAKPILERLQVRKIPVPRSSRCDAVCEVYAQKTVWMYMPEQSTQILANESGYGQKRHVNPLCLTRVGVWCERIWQHGIDWHYTSAWERSLLRAILIVWRVSVIRVLRVVVLCMVVGPHHLLKLVWVIAKCITDRAGVSRWRYIAATTIRHVWRNSESIVRIDS